MERLLTNNGNILSVNGSALLCDVPLRWNQVFTPSSGGNDYSGNGITITKNADGRTWTISGEATANIRVTNWVWWADEVKDHKYIVRRTLKDRVSLNNNLYSGITLNNTTTVQTGGQKNGNYPNGQPINLVIDEGADFENGAQLEIQIFDLTLMYGEGHEPAIAEFAELFPANYYPYNPGKPVQLCQNGNFADKSAWYASNSTWAVENNIVTLVSSTGTTTAKYLRQIGIFTLNHVYYYYGTVRVIDAGRAALSVANNSTNGTISGVNNETTAFVRIENRYVHTDGTITPRFELRMPNNTAQGLSVQAKNINFIDLTATFGSGNEPTIEACREIFADEHYEYYNPN